jgi:tetratricopeptide (TPR) repeat protein
MMASVFRIDEVRQDNDLWHINLTLCGCKELDQEKLAERWKECLEKNSSLHALYLRNSKNLELSEASYRRFSRIESSTADFHLDGYDDSVETNQRFLDMFEQILEPTHRNIIDCHNSLGLAYSAKGDYMRTMISFEQALHLLQAAHDEGNEKIVLCLHNIAHQHMKQNVLRKALLYTALKNLDGALNHLEHALQMRINSLPEDHVSISKIYRAMAAIYTSKGDHCQAGFLLGKAWTIGSDVLLNLLPFLGVTGQFLHDLSSQR